MPRGAEYPGLRGPDASIMSILASVSQQTALLIITFIVLIGVLSLAFRGIGRPDTDQKFIFGVIGLLLGLFGGGGIGALVGGQSADQAANNVKTQVRTVATQAAMNAANNVKGEVNNAVKSGRPSR